MKQGEAGYRWVGTQVSRCAGQWQGDPVSLLRERSALAQLADRIRSGCVYEVQSADTFGLLVTRDDPRRRWRTRPVLAPIQAHWALFAPSVFLLTGHERACRSRHCRGVGRCEGHIPLQLGWPAFAAAYRSELEQRPLPTCLAVLRQILAWLSTYPTLTVLSFESGTPKGEALRGWEQQGQLSPWAQRQIFRDWVVSLLPLEAQGGKANGHC